jgi:hypothetical protein
LLGPSVIHEICDHCGEIRGVVGVGFQIVLVFVHGGLRLSLDVLDDSRGIASQLIQERVDPVKGSLQPRGSNVSRILELRDLASKGVDVFFDLVIIAAA